MPSRNYWFCLLCLLFIYTPVKAQFYVNMECGLKWDLVETFASEGDFNFSNRPDFMGGARVGFEINPYLALELGVYVHQLNNNYIYRLDGVSWLAEEQWLPAQFLQFPLRLKTTIFTIQKKMSIHPYLGLALLVHRHERGQYEWRFQQQVIEDPTNRSSFKYEYNASFKSRYLLLGEAGLMAQYKITQHFSITLSLGFTLGSTSIHNSLLYWERKTPALDDEGILNAEYKGDQISLMLGVQCLFKK
ncbi:MAG: Unknown protein [uncultured Aureispira sp.]|uniref:Outer membrane protein beta-barrel domain-containing protein n=1 Tax=uncultured Aureispira sp. TaxID=1331704 RepID=A0A6S6U6E9_9BACT|nr:MAG: Unknown protein [uncultured Aureispira sp.]